jgi:hypothetical protein
MIAPIWDQLSTMAAELAPLDALSKKQMMLLKNSAIQMQNYFEANEELREDVERLQIDCKKYRNAIAHMGESCRELGLYAVKNSHEFGDHSFVRDNAPHINLMANLGFAEYGTPERPRPSKMLRQSQAKP